MPVYGLDTTMPAEPEPDLRLRPFEAARAVGRLMRTPGDTRQIFVLLRAMRGRSGQRAFRRFAASATGAAILRERRSLRATLEDRAMLVGFEAGTMGRAYLDFMEAQKLSVEALVEASDNQELDILPPDPTLYRDRVLAAHDLNHVLTGYGRDMLGEYCLMAFMHAHTRNPGMVLIVAMGWLRLPSSAARRAVAEAWRNGRKARWLLGQDFEALLPRSLETVRQELGIADPALYRAIVSTTPDSPGVI